MTNQDFINNIVSLYRKSRLLSVDKSNHNIWRGVSHSISSLSEDLFALFIAKKLNDVQLEYIVDKTMSLQVPFKNAIQFRPDLAIVKNGVLTHAIDLKMDMGYKRRYHETEAFFKEQNKFKQFRNNDEVKVFYKIDKRKRRELSVSKNIINQVVVISEKNEGKLTNRTDIINAVKDLDWMNIYYLTGEVHPNNYSNEMPVIRNQEFERLISDIKSNLI